MILSRNFLAVALIAFVAGAASAETFTLSGDNTKVEFTGAKKDGKHTGGFKKVAGTATVKDAADPTTLALSVTIDVDSLYTDDAKLTTHLKSPDFFEVKKFPEAKFVTTKVAKGKEGYDVTGDLTLHGKTKAVTFPAAIKSSADSVTLTAKFSINRSDWGISFGKGQINEAVDIAISVAAKAK